jgi:hypothetical protein
MKMLLHQAWGRTGEIALLCFFHDLDEQRSKSHMATGGCRLRGRQVLQHQRGRMERNTEQLSTSSSEKRVRDAWRGKLDGDDDHALYST